MATHYMTIDYGAYGPNSVAGYWERGDADEARAILDEHCRIAAANGVAGINFRVTGQGRGMWQSNIIHPFTVETSGCDQGLCTLLAGGYDPYAEIVAACRRHGLKVFAWFDLFDWYKKREAGGRWPHPHHLWHPWFEQHPQYYLVSKTGVPLRGVPCYAYPEVVEHIMSMLRELVAYGGHGIYFGTRTHAGPNAPRPLEDDQYGYNEPMVREFERRFGVDPATGFIDSEYRWEKWQDLKGEYITAFLRTASKLIHDAGQAVFIDLFHRDTIMLGTIQNDGGYEQLRMEFQPPLCRARMDFPTWIDEGLIDALFVNHGRYNPGKQVNDLMMERFRPHTQGHIPLMLYAWLPNTPQRVHEICQLVNDAKLDGAMWQSMIDFMFDTRRHENPDESLRPFTEPQPESGEMWRVFKAEH